MYVPGSISYCTVSCFKRKQNICLLNQTLKSSSLLTGHAVNTTNAANQQDNAPAHHAQNNVRRRRQNSSIMHVLLLRASTFYLNLWILNTQPLLHSVASTAHCCGHCACKTQLDLTVQDAQLSLRNRSQAVNELPAVGQMPHFEIFASYKVLWPWNLGQGSFKVIGIWHH